MSPRHIMPTPVRQMYLSVYDSRDSASEPAPSPSPQPHQAFYDNFHETDVLECVHRLHPLLSETSLLAFVLSVTINNKNVYPLL